ncbi:hypothetical protein [Streptomyces sp. NBC_00105]|uniref:hypothetical protein n=1 Tax=Streptomyces sp. NBC_00105 TaxID=2903622 RepID=UPI00324F473F
MSSAPEDTDAVLPLEAGAGPVLTAVRVEVAGPAAVRLEVASSLAAAVTVCVVAVPAQVARSPAKERAPW